MCLYSHNQIIRSAIPCSLFLVLLFCLVPYGKAEQVIHGVNVSSPLFDYGKKPQITVSWQQHNKGKTTLFISDLYGNIVATLLKKEPLPAGSHSTSWDGKDDTGGRLPNGIYFPIVTCKTRGKGTFVHNPTTLDWGKAVTPSEMQYDVAQGTITLGLDQQSYGRLRIGFKDGGPVLHTVANWQLFEPRSYVFSWISALYNLRSDQVSLVFDNLTLPIGGIVIVNSPVSHTAVEESYKKIPINPPQGQDISYFSYTPSGLLPEPVIKVEWETGSVKDGLPTFTDLVRCTVSYSEPGIGGSFNRGSCELMFFIDGIFVTEASVTELPATLEYATTELTRGKHSATINFVTSDIRTGIVSKEIFINKN